MARPKKGMSDQERQALDAAMIALRSGTFIYNDHRLAMGVLRELAPEFADQLIPRRGQQPANDLRQRVHSHYAILSDPRFREFPTSPRGALPQQEIVKRIAEAEGVSAKHVRTLLVYELADSRAENEDNAKRLNQLKLKQAEQQDQRNNEVRNEYTKAIANLFDKYSIRAIAAFDKTFETAHHNAVTRLSERFGTDVATVSSLLQLAKEKACERLKKETLENLRYR